MGMEKDRHHETIIANSRTLKHKRDGLKAAEADYYSEQRRHRENKARQERDKDIPVAPPVFPRYEGRRAYPANPATDAERFERVCREADAEAKKKGMNIVVFKNREDNYFTWEEAYISGANDITALYTAKSPIKESI